MPLHAMSVPKLRHYVPQFYLLYLRRFLEDQGRLWVWDRDRDWVFLSSPRSVAAETNFYFLDEIAEQGRDPLTMEWQLADLECPDCGPASTAGTGGAVRTGRAELRRAIARAWVVAPQATSVVTTLTPAPRRWNDCPHRPAV